MRSTKKEIQNGFEFGLPQILIKHGVYYVYNVAIKNKKKEAAAIRIHTKVGTYRYLGRDHRSRGDMKKKIKHKKVGSPWPSGEKKIAIDDIRIREIAVGCVQ